MFLTSLTALAVGVYLVATLCHFAALAERAPRWSSFARLFSGIAALGHVAAMIALVVARGVPSLFTIHGGVGLGGLLLSLMFLALTWRRAGLLSLGALVAPCALLSLMPSLFGASGSTPPVAGALGSVLLTVHIIAALLGTAAFVFAFVLAAVYLVQQQQLQKKRFFPWLRRLPSLERLDRLSLRVTLVGFFIYTLSILLGSLWAWRNLGLRLEARSLLATLTWAVYALMIQGRITAGWQGRKAAQLTVAGTLCAVSVVVVYLARG